MAVATRLPTIAPPMAHSPVNAPRFHSAARSTASTSAVKYSTTPFIAIAAGLAHINTSTNMISRSAFLPIPACSTAAEGSRNGTLGAEGRMEFGRLRHLREDFGVIKDAVTCHWHGNVTDFEHILAVDCW